MTEVTSIHLEDEDETGEGLAIVKYGDGKVRIFRHVSYQEETNATLYRLVRSDGTRHESFLEIRAFSLPD